MKKENRLGLIAIGIVIGVFALFALAIAIRSQESTTTKNTDRQPPTIDVEKIIDIMTSQSNGVILFNKQGQIDVIHGDVYPVVAHLPFMFSLLGNLTSHKRVDAMGRDCYMVPLAKGMGSRYSRSQAIRLLEDWIRVGTLADLKRANPNDD
jgi:hypothetical protein